MLNLSWSNNILTYSSHLLFKNTWAALDNKRNWVINSRFDVEEVEWKSNQMVLDSRINDSYVLYALCDSTNCVSSLERGPRVLVPKLTNWQRNTCRHRQTVRSHQVDQLFYAGVSRISCCHALLLLALLWRQTLTLACENATPVPGRGYF